MGAALIVPVGLAASQATTGGDVPGIDESAADTAVPFSEYGVDPRLGDMIEDHARAVLGDRYVNLSVTEDQQGYLLCVFDKAPTDDASLEGLNMIAPVEVTACPVSRAELDTAMDAARDLAGEGFVFVAPDYTKGLVRLGVLPGRSEKMVSRLSGVEGLRVVRDGAPASASKPGAIVVSVVTADSAVPAEVLDPPETAWTGPLRAAKTIVPLLCTSNALVELNSTRYMLTAGHCSQVGNSITYGDAVVGTMAVSTFHSSPNNATIPTDAGMFSVPSTAKPSVFISPTFAEDVVGRADPLLNQPACFHGRTTGVEVCGTVSDMLASGTVAGGDPPNMQVRTIEDVAVLDVVCQQGDSGAPVYYKTPSGVVILGVVFGNAYTSTWFSPIGKALTAVGGAEVVTKLQAFSNASVYGSVFSPGNAWIPGEVVRANTSSSPAADSWTFQWFRSGILIPGETDSTYLLTPFDEERVISVQATAHKVGYSPMTTSMYSFQVHHPMSAAVSIPASATVGQTVTGTISCNSPSLSQIESYWMRGPNLTTIPGSDKSIYYPPAGTTQFANTYVVQPGDQGLGLFFQAVCYDTLSWPWHLSGMLVSKPMAVGPGVSPTLPRQRFGHIYSDSGTLAVGTVAKVNPTSVPTASVWYYQWKRNGVDIPGATSGTYLLTPSDALKEISVSMSINPPPLTPPLVPWSDLDSLPRTVHHGFSTAVASLPSSASVGQMATVSVSCSPNPDDLLVYWTRNGSEIPGSSGFGATTYVTTSADAGQSIKAMVYCVKTDYSSGRIWSGGMTVY